MSNTAFRHRKLGQLATFINGSAFRPSDWGNLGLPIIRIQNLNGSSDFNYYTGRRVKCVPVEPGDLLFSWSGSIGTSFGAHRWSGQAGVLNQHIFKVVPADGVNPGLLYHVLRFATSRLEQMAHGGAGLVHIKKSVLVDFEVKLPTNARHLTRVATLLDLAESAVSATDALIAAKREQKRGLMQQLLTGKVRFPGFTEPWKTVRLGDVAQEVSERNKGQLAAQDVCGVIKGAGLMPMRERVMGDDLTRYLVVNPHSFAYNPMRLNIGSIAFNTSHRRVLVSPDYVVFSTRSADLQPEYLNHVRTSWIWEKFVQRAGSGSVRTRIYFDDLAMLKLPLPGPTEQERINAVLRDHNTEIRLLLQQRETLATQRLGLMENLLSGDITIPSSDTSAA